jgi:hypothetical protein
MNIAADQLASRENPASSIKHRASSIEHPASSILNTAKSSAKRNLQRSPDLPKMNIAADQLASRENPASSIEHPASTILKRSGNLERHEIRKESGPILHRETIRLTASSILSAVPIYREYPALPQKLPISATIRLEPSTQKKQIPD